MSEEDDSSSSDDYPNVLLRRPNSVPQIVYESSRSPASQSNNLIDQKMKDRYSSFGHNESKSIICFEDKEILKAYKRFKNNYVDSMKTNPDIVAMSTLSLYNSAKDLDIDMDTSRDFISNEQKTDLPKKNKSAPLASPVESNIISNVTPSSKSRDTLKSTKSTKTIAAQNTLYFKDGTRSVDFILVWDSYYEKAITEVARERRRVFEENLRKEGLDLEHEFTEKNGLNYVKIHAPREVLRRYSEILKLRMPMKKELSVEKLGKYSIFFEISQKIHGYQEYHGHTNIIIDEINSIWSFLISKIKVDKKKFPDRDRRFTAIYSRDKEYLFDLETPGFFTPAIHSRIVQFILDRKRFSENLTDDFAFGIERLLHEYTYSAAYPLHDGDLHKPGSMRYLLASEWASVRKCLRYQPLDYVKEYFGIKIALYFAWLGFYTHMLIPASVVGLACFIFSWSTIHDFKPNQDICNGDLNIKMCPLCDKKCGYWDLQETCIHAKITYLFDNPTTVFFAIFMSFWATLFLELWKRYSAEITHRWDLTGFDIKEEHPRPQYLARLAHVKRRRVNVITNTMEPEVPFWCMKLPVTILSFSVVILLVALAVAAVLGVVLYRMSVLASLSFHQNPVLTSYAILITTTSAATMNLCLIMVFNWIYTYLAEYLTELELLRTQTEFDDSLTLKIYLLQFVNYYASIFYIAFFKGRITVGHPGHYNRLFGILRQEECGPGGCLLELCIQLAIIMVGKQAMNTALEMILPLFWKYIYAIQFKAGFRRDYSSSRFSPQWVKDYKLLEWGPRGLFPEYLEMVLQYGFVTIFVAAFPLAPFFALLNNVFEMRLDAKKLLRFYRRPISQRVRNIGVWYRILDSIGKLSVITNGFIIAFTSEFIPRLVYTVAVNPDHSLDGYLNYSLSAFNTKDFPEYEAPENNDNITVCRYLDYREPKKPYELTSMFWHVLAARLAFVVIFENVVAFVMILVRWCIPDIPSELRDRIRREAYITNEIIIKQETMRAQSAYTEPQRKRRTENEDVPTNVEQWDRIINKCLSGSDMDLLLHHEAQGGDTSVVRRRPNSDPPTLA